MRFRSPSRDAVDCAVFDAPVFAGLARFRELLCSTDWPSLDLLNGLLAAVCRNVELPYYRLQQQTPALLADGLHYETRIATQRIIASRQESWHDLLNVLVWLQHPRMKHALSLRQAADVGIFGARQRSRAQCALTHFDEAGVVLVLRDAERLAAWDRHDWPGLFAGLEVDAFAVCIVGHALLEHALDPGRLLCGKAIAVLAPTPDDDLAAVLAGIAIDIAGGRLLEDPQELRPLPLMGLPGWHPRASDLDFLRQAPCFQPLRSGRCYPPSWRPRGGVD
jgi:hypothetical protein